MPIFLMNGSLSVKLKKKPDFEEYFKFLDEYFLMFNINIETLSKKRKPITGKLFLL